MFRTSLAVAALLIAVPAMGAVQRVWTGQGSDVSHLTCAADDSLDAGACSATSACQTGTSTPGTCTVGECFFDTDETAGLNLYWCTSTDTWTLTGTGLDHGLLSGLSDDDHTQYALLAGRSGGQTLNGSPDAGEDLTLDANSTDTAGDVVLDSAVDLFPSFPDVSSGNNVVVQFTPEIDVEGVLTDIRVLELSPNIDTGQANGNLMGLRLLTTNGTWDVNDNTGTITSPAGIQLVRSGFKTTSTVAGTEPAVITLMIDGSVTEYDAATTTATAASEYSSFFANQQHRARGTGTYDMTGGYTGFKFVPRLNAAGSSDMQMAIIRGLRITDIAESGTTANITTTTYVGVDIEALTTADTSMGVRNAATTVYTPTLQAVTSAATTIAPVATVVRVTSNATINLTDDPQISDGQDGQLLIVFLSGSNSLQFDNGAGLVMPAGSCNLNAAGDNIQFMYSSTIGDWIEIARTGC